VLRKEGFNLGRYATRSLMKKLGLSGHQRRRKYVYARNISAAMPNHLGREFSVEAPNKKWVTDITYIPTRQGWCYLAAVVDLYSRKVVGWDVAKTMTAELALRALRQAKLLRQPKDSVLVHSDQGSQYTSGEWRDYAASNGVELSQSRRGNCWDNAVMERFWQSEIRVGERALLCRCGKCKAGHQ
jgi:putative transposase